MTSLKPRHTAVLERLLSQEQQELFTDLEVHLQDGMVRASRNLLAALSDPFRQMLAANMVEGRRRILNLEHVTMNTWSCIFQFYLSNRDCVSCANVLCILEFSHMYQLDELQEHCCSFMMKSSSPANCLGSWRLARVLELELLTTLNLRTICRNFLHVGKQEDFLDLTSEELLELLGNSDLVTTEDQLCSALLRWVEKNDAPEDIAGTIFNHVQYERLSSVMLAKLAGNKRFQQDASISSKLAQEQDVIRRLGGPRICPTTPSTRGTSEEVIVFVGHDFYHLCIFTWSPGSQEWSPVCRYEYPKRFSCLKHRDTIIITGGMLDMEAANTTVLFDLKTATMSLGQKLRKGRYLHGMAAIDDMVFVVGGDDVKGGCVSCIERCHAVDTCFSWKTCGDMRKHFKKYFFTQDIGGVATLGRNLIIALVNENDGTCFLSFNADTGASTLLPVHLPVYDFCKWAAASYEGEASFLCADGCSLYRFTGTPDGKILYKGAISLDSFTVKLPILLFYDGYNLQLFEDTRESDPVEPVRCFNLEGHRLKDNDLPSLPRDMDVMGAYLTRSLKA